MKDHLQIFDTRKFLIIMLIGLVCYVISFVITLLNIKNWGFFTCLLLPTMIFMSFIPIGLFLAKGNVYIEINKGSYLVKNKTFQLKDILSYDFITTDNSYRFILRLKNRSKISIAIRDSYRDKDKFMIIVDQVLQDIQNYNSRTDLHKILKYDFYKTKNAKLLGIFFIIFDLFISYLTLFNDSKRVPIQMKYFGALIINLIILTYLYRIFKKE